MIDSRIGNPKFQIEILQDFFSRYGVKDFMKSEVPLEYLEYQFDDYRKYDDIIRNYYKNVLNHPIPQDKSIIIGQGTNGSVSSVLWAISKLMKKTSFDPLKIYQINKPPTYNVFYNSANTVPNTVFKINGLNLPNDYDDYYFTSHSIMYTGKNLSSGIDYNEETCDISVAISPNNPTGELIYDRYGHFQIIDSVYDIPLFTNENQFLNKEITGREIFAESFSKIGFASYRFGWAITSDPMISSWANKYSRQNHNGLITPSYFSTEQIINTFIQTRSFNDFAKINYETFTKRKNIIYNLMLKNNVFIPEYNRKYSPYAFVPISKSKFESIGIDTRTGEDFFMSNKYSRFNLMMKTNDFNKMINILNEKFYTIV